MVETQVARFPNARVMLKADLSSWLPLFDIHLTETEIQEVLAASDGRLSEYVRQSGEAVFPTSAHIIGARTPRKSPEAT